MGVATEALGERGGLDVVTVAPDPLDQQADDGGGEHEEEQAGDDQDPERGSRRGDGRRDTSRGHVTTPFPVAPRRRAACGGGSPG